MRSLVLIISMKVFITGINSFVGKRLTEKLDNLSIISAVSTYQVLIAQKLKN